MDILEHYINMRLSFSKVNEHEEVYTTTGELAGILSCTMRNTNIIVKKFLEQEWVSWIPQKGRGRKSPLIFRLSLLEAARMYLNQLTREKRIEEAYIFATSSYFPSSVKEVLVSLLQNHFGLQSTNKTNQRMDILKIPTDAQIHTLDPTKIAIVHEAHIASQIFDTLLRYDKASQSFQPGLALAWEEKLSGKEWTFYLRKGVLFHHGRTMTSEDIQYTFNRLRSDKTIPTREMFDVIEKVEVYDDITVNFVLKAPSYLFLDLISSFYASILPCDVTFSDKKPIGTGPFKVNRHEEHLLILDAFQSYFEGRPFLDQIEYWYIPRSLTEETNHPIKENHHKKTTYKELGSFFLAFNLQKRGIHHDQHFRLALKHLLDGKRLVSELGLPRRQAASSFLDYKSNDRSLFSLDKALEHLALSGYKGEVIEVATFRFKEGIEDMNWLKRMCQAVGIHLNVTTVPLSMIYSKNEVTNYDAFYVGETFEENEALSLFIMYKSENSVLRMILNEPYRKKLDLMLEKVAGESSLLNRMEQFLMIEEWLCKEAIIILTYHTLEEQNYHQALSGIEFSGYGMPNFRRLWVKRSREESGSELVSYSIYIP